MLTTRRTRGWNPWQEMERMERQVNRIFSDIEGASFHGTPRLNAWVKNDQAIVEAELPGYDSKQIDLSVDGQELTIRGSRENENAGPDGKVKYHLRERRAGRFERKLRLPFRVEADRVEAAFHNGLLTITLPQAESDKAIKIAVTEKLN